MCSTSGNDSFDNAAISLPAGATLELEAGSSNSIVTERSYDISCSGPMSITGSGSLAAGRIYAYGNVSVSPEVQGLNVLIEQFWFNENFVAEGSAKVCGSISIGNDYDTFFSELGLPLEVPAGSSVSIAQGIKLTMADSGIIGSGTIYLNGELVFPQAFTAQQINELNIVLGESGKISGLTEDGTAQDIHYCVYDREIAEDRYLKTEASCTAQAEYYYSCACGNTG